MYDKIFEPESKKFVNSYSEDGISLINSYSKDLYGGSSVSNNYEKLTNGRLNFEKNLLQALDTKENVDQFKSILYSTNSLLAGGFLVRSYTDFDSDMGDLDIYVQNKHAVSMLLYLNSVGFEMEFWNMAPPYDQSFFRKNNIMSRTYLEKNNYEHRDYLSWNEGDTVLVKSMWKSADRTLFAVDFGDRALWGTSKAVIKRKILGGNPDEIYIVSWADENYKDSIVYRNDIFSLRNISCDLMIIPDFIEPKQVVQNFDLTFCEIWFDGKTVDATDIDGVLNKKGFLRKEYTDSLLTKFNKFLIDRIKRYSNRGFNITINTNKDSYNINTEEIVNLNKSNGYRYPKVESYEAWFVTQVYKALICTRNRWNFKLYKNNTKTKITLIDDPVILKKKNDLISWLWMVENPLQKRTINNLVEICEKINEKTNEINTIAKLYDDNVNKDLLNNYFYNKRTILSSIQKYWFILLHFNSHQHKKRTKDQSDKIYSHISCTHATNSKYGCVRETNIILPYPYQTLVPINLKDRRVLEDNEIFQKILPSEYKKVIAKHTNILWNNKENVLRLFYNNSGKFKPKFELIINGFSFVNDEKYEQYISYLRKINIFFDHPFNNFYGDSNLVKYWKKQTKIESLDFINIDESVHKTCLDFLNIEDDIELEKSQEIIDLEEELINVNEKRAAAMLVRPVNLDNINKYMDLSKKIREQLQEKKEPDKDNINPKNRNINSWLDVNERFVIIIEGRQSICYSISEILDITRDYYYWLYECTGEEKLIEEGPGEKRVREEKGWQKPIKYDKPWFGAVYGKIIPFTKYGDILYGGIVIDDDIGGYVYADVNELRSMILHVLNDEIKVFHFTNPKTITHTVSFDGIFDPDFNETGRNHCQYGSNIICYNIKICKGTKCIPRKTSGTEQISISNDRMSWPKHHPSWISKLEKLKELPDDSPCRPKSLSLPIILSTHSEFFKFELIMNHPFKSITKDKMNKVINKQNGGRYEQCEICEISIDKPIDGKEWSLTGWRYRKALSQGPEFYLCPVCLLRVENDAQYATSSFNRLIINARDLLSGCQVQGGAYNK